MKSDHETVQAGREAKGLLEHPAHKAACEAIEQVLINQLAVFEISAERAEYLRQLFAASRKYRQLLERAITEGKFSEAALDQQEAIRRMTKPKARV